jgi:DNA-directed RNA polymerase specialized sigma subunit
MNEKCVNTKIEEALKDENITKIMHMASKRFKNQLDSDIIHTCQINALWKAILNHDPNKAAKFTTYLYHGVFIECMKEIKFKNKSNRMGGKLHENLTINSDPFLMIDILDELKDSKDKQLFLDKISNMTIAEIAEKHGTNRESTRRRIHKIMNNIQKKFA